MANASERIMAGEVARCTNCGNRFSTKQAAELVDIHQYIYGEAHLRCPQCDTIYHPIDGGGCGHYIQSQRFQNKKIQLRAERRSPNWMEMAHKATYVYGWRGYPLAK